MARKKSQTTAKQAAAWDMAKPLLDAMYKEFKELSKKKPDGAASKAKIAVVNRLLEKCRETLQGEDSLAFLDVLDEDDLPQNSDVVLMLSQYVAAMEAFREQYYGFNGLETTWLVGGR